MNSDILAVVGCRDEGRARAALAEVEATFAECERVLSRFRPDSELSRLNGGAGRPFRASPLLFQVVADALGAARDTDGLFDPTILGDLVAAGYDRSFELLRGDQANAASPFPGVGCPGHPGAPVPPAERGITRGRSWREGVLDRATRTILLPEGVGLDLGGIGKGWTVDRAVERLRPFGSFALDAGGDLYAGGSQPDGSPWTVGIENPFDPGSDLAVLAVADEAVATSSIGRRRWWKDGQERHHLIDPRTGQPARSGVVSATVVAPSVARAELLAKTALLLGPEEGARYLGGQPDAEGVLVLADGRVVLPPEIEKVHHAI